MNRFACWFTSAKNCRATSDVKPLSRHTINAQARKVRDKLGLPWDCVLHSCRHTFGSKLGMSGADVFTIQLAMGHASVTMSQRYVQINIQRAWSKGKLTAGKNQNSMTQVVMSPVLAEELKNWRRLTLYREPTDWIFPSTKGKGKIPRSASICSKSYLRPAAIKAGVIPKEYAGRFGWHNLRHSLATFLSANEVHLSVTQSMLRHKKMSTTAEIYTHRASKPQLDAQALFLTAIGRNKTRAGANAGAEAQKQRAQQ